MPAARPTSVLTIIGLLAAALAGASGSIGSAAAQGIMYASESGRQFYTINLATGAKTLLGNMSIGNGIPASMAYDCATQTTYVASTGGFAGQQRNLYTLNPITRQTTVVGPFGDLAVLMHGIEIDTRTGTLFAVSTHNHELYSLSRTTGAATIIGPTGIPVGPTTFNALGYDAFSGIMYMTDTGTDSLYTVNLTTGAATLVGPLNGPIGIGALAYNVDNRTMYLVDNDADNLYTVNLATGAATLVGPTGMGNLIGLVYITPTCPPPPPPECAADFNDDGFANSQDFFEYLTAFFASDISADFGGDGIVNSQDLFDYLVAFFEGC